MTRPGLAISPQDRDEDRGLWNAWHVGCLTLSASLGWFIGDKLIAGASWVVVTLLVAAGVL
ncbi:hypothetical protein [Falsiroseomonas tokyonensis]|uniref:Uncharacterized protein n=1 Tax=Falsiroseomonas tokyonensis TaxID=430521 RepID=A0ABV7C1L6_9PROT|nr:hypothetical protein [Falsiroseomonas tokyonensis]MBU8540847.1 hypothetical protein [Falsiroseomonas tokyonensis]